MTAMIGAVAAKKMKKMTTATATKPPASRITAKRPPRLVQLTLLYLVMFTLIPHLIGRHLFVQPKRWEDGRINRRVNLLLNHFPEVDHLRHSEAPLLPYLVPSVRQSQQSIPAINPLYRPPVSQNPPKRSGFQQSRKMSFIFQQHIHRSQVTSASQCQRRQNLQELYTQTWALGHCPCDRPFPINCNRRVLTARHHSTIPNT